MLFHRDDWTLFRNLNTLGQKAGVPRERLAALVLKELVDNALDAGANVSVGRLHGAGFYVEDDGPGIPGNDEEIARLFSIHRPLLSGKLLRLPLRGALGNGLRVVAGAVLASGGKLAVRTRGRHLSLSPRDDGHTDFHVVEDGLDDGGTRVEIQFGADLARQSDVLELAERAVAMRGLSRYEGKTSAWWYDSDSFFELLQASDATVGEVLGHFREYRKSEIDSTPSRHVSRDEAERLLLALRDVKSKQKAPALGEVGEGAVHGVDGYAKKFGEFRLAAARGNVSAEIPGWWRSSRRGRRGIGVRACSCRRCACAGG